MKKILILTIALLSIFTTTFADDNIFTDIENHWAKDIIVKMVKDGTVNGVDKDHFEPNKEIAICEFIKILVEEADYKLVTKGTRWPDWYINTAIEQKLITSNEFSDYLQPLKRIDACKILSNYIDLSDVKKAKKSFNDISKENQELILKLVNLEIISGYNDNSFRENDYLTRAQACKMISAAYDAKNDLMNNRKYKITSCNSNLGLASSGDEIKNRYSIVNNRLMVTDSGRYAKLDNATLNQEYVDDKLVIKLLNALVDDSSYTAVLFVPDKYTINSLNVCYGSKQGYINDGDYIFQIRFYENGNYNLAESTGISSFGSKAYLRIELDKMWDKLSEYDNELRASKKNLKKLENALEALFNEKVSKELIDYIEEKILEAKSIPNNEFDFKICETKIIGAYTFDVLCTRDEKIQLYVRRNK